MIWYFVKGGLLLFPLFIGMGLIGNLVCLFLYLYRARFGKWHIDHFLKSTIWIATIIGFAGFTIIGAVYASYTFSLEQYMDKWLAILLVSIFVLFVAYYSRKGFFDLHKKNSILKYEDFLNYANASPYKTYVQVVNQYIIVSFPTSIVSFVLCIIFQKLTNSLSGGLSTYLMEIIR